LFERYIVHMGRPPKFNEPERLTIRIDKADFDRLREIADHEEMPYGNIVRKLVQNYTKRWKPKLDK